SCCSQRAARRHVDSSRATLPTSACARRSTSRECSPTRTSPRFASPPTTISPRTAPAAAMATTRSARWPTADERLPDLAQLLLDAELVRDADAHHDLLAGRHRLELLVGEGVDDLRLRKRHRRARLGRGEQIVDCDDQPVVEVL